jgi:hypothetical protein
MKAIVQQTNLVKTIDPKLSGQALRAVIGQYIQSHLQEHNNLMSAINSLNMSVNNEPLKSNPKLLVWNPDNPKSFNDFLYQNSLEHQTFYLYINKLGTALPNYNKEPMFVFPKMNPISSVGYLDIATLNKFIMLELNVHRMVFNAVNLLYNAYGA